MLRLRRVSPNYRELFVARYERLRVWALQLAQGDRALAEDLLHDLYVLFTIHEPQIDPSQNVDGYLYTCLRNLYLSQIRRTTRARFQQISIIEYESARTGLRNVDARAQLEAQDELRRICQYACLRKDSSRAGGVLILRFFHGYYPSEIMRLMRCSRRAVDDRLDVARTEARTYLDDPGRLSFLSSGNSVTEIFPATFARTGADLLGELRQMIFASRQGECISRERLQNFYRAPSQEASALALAELSHLVSCSRCLDEVNGMLKLPPLSQRYLSDNVGRDSGGHGGDGGSATGGSEPPPPPKASKERGPIDSSSLRVWDEDGREAFEHRPQELCVAVNGFLLGSQKVGQEENELTLSLNGEEKPSFIEVFSELGIRLSMLNIGDPPPEGSGEQRLQVKLSDARELGLTIHFTTPFLTLNVSYNDPGLKSVGAISFESAADNPLSLPPADVQGRPTTFELGRRRVSIFIQSLRARLFTSNLWLRPATVTALFALILIASLLLYLRVPTPMVIAGDLLRRATDAEAAIATRKDQVLHHTVNMEERNSKGELIAQHRIEIWQSAARGITARRLYNEKGELVAGDWRRQDGVQTLYQHGARPQMQLIPEQRDANITPGFNNVWQLSPSPKEFAALIRNTAVARVEEQPDAYLISYEASSGRNEGNVPDNQTTPPATTASLVRATLVLSRSDLRPIEQTLIIRQGSETREYRLIETSFEQRAPSAVAPTVFEPEPELLSERAKDETGKAKGKSSSSSPLVVSPTAVAASPELEVEVLRLVHQTGADLGDQVSVRRAADGQLQVQGIVETEERKDQIVQALSPVAHNPAVRIRVESLEALKQQAKSQSSSSPTTVERLESAATKVPVDAELRRYFSAKGLTGVELDQRVNDFAEQIGNRSLRALRQAGALQRLAQRFSTEQLRGLDPEARGKWLGMLREHAQSLQRELSGLRQELRPFADFSPTGGSRALPKIETDRDLQQAANRLFELCSTNDQAIRSAFTILPNSSNGAAIKSSQFWASLQSAESLAARIADSR